VPLLSEPDQTVEDGLGPLHGRLGTAQDNLIPPHDDLALDELFDPPQDGVAIPEDLERPARWYDELDFYLAAGCCFRVFSFDIGVRLQVLAVSFSIDDVSVKPQIPPRR